MAKYYVGAEFSGHAVFDKKGLILQFPIDEAKKIEVSDAQFNRLKKQGYVLKAVAVVKPEPKEEVEVKEEAAE